MRKGVPESKEGDKKREKTSDKMSGTRSVAQLHEHSGVRGTTAPSVISERSDSCDIPGIHFRQIDRERKREKMGGGGVHTTQGPELIFDTIDTQSIFSSRSLHQSPIISLYTDHYIFVYTEPQNFSLPKRCKQNFGVSSKDPWSRS